MLVKDALVARGITDRYRVSICENEKSATFVLYNPTNKKLRGYQKYNPFNTSKKMNDVENGRYYTYQPKVKGVGDSAVFGLEYCDNVEGNLLFVTEGVFDAVRILNEGHNAIAILSSDASRYLLKELEGLGGEVVWCGDDDDAGNRSNMNRIAKHRMCFDVDIDEVGEARLKDTINALQ